MFHWQTKLERKITNLLVQHSTHLRRASMSFGGGFSDPTQSSQPGHRSRLEGGPVAVEVLVGPGPVPPLEHCPAAAVGVHVAERGYRQLRAVRLEEVDAAECV